MIRRLALCCLLFQSTAFSQTFQEYCEQVDTLSTGQRQFVYAVLDSVGADCADAESKISLTGALTIYHRQLTDISLLSSLSGVVKQLALIDNNIEDISVIAQMDKLVSLDLSENTITDVSVLAKRPSLKTLQLSDNSIKDISPIQNLVQLEDLTLIGNPIVDYGSLEKMINLRHLRVGEQRFTSDSRCPSSARGAESTAIAESLEKTLKNFTKLNGFISRGINLKSLAAIEAHPNLEYLIVECASIEQTRAFLVWKNLRSLVLPYNRISHIDAPEKPHKVGHINLAGNYLDDANFLNKISDASVINLSDNRLKGEFRMRSLPSLTSLNLSGNSIRYIELNGDFPSLWDIDVRSNALSYIEFANRLQKVQYFNASNNRLINPAAGFNFDGIVEVHLQNNRIADYSFVNKIDSNNEHSPRLLNVGGNPGKDFSIISHPRIRMFYAEESQLSDIEALPNLPNLEYLEVARNSFTNLDGLGSRYSRIKSLNASENPLTRLDAEDDTIVFSRLNLSKTKIRSFDFLESQYLLHHLELSGNSIADVSPLKGLTRLLVLNLSHNKIEDVNDLPVGKNYMYELDLSDNEILDATPLGKLKGLDNPKRLFLGQNPLGTTVSKTPENCPTQSASSALNAWCVRK